MTIDVIEVVFDLNDYATKSIEAIRVVVFFKRFGEQVHRIITLRHSLNVELVALPVTRSARLRLLERA